MGIDKVLKMIDLVGSQKGYDMFKEQTMRMLADSLNKEAFWLQYKMIGDHWASNSYVTDKKSILPTLFTAAKLNLHPDPVMRQIYFIPYGGELTYQVGYIGMIELANRAGKSVRSNLVYEKDVWEYEETERGQHFLHRENFLDNNRGKELFAYSVFTDRATGFCQVHTMRSDHINKIKQLVLARMKTSSTPWKDPLFEPEMRKKTCVRRHSKTEPFSVEMALVIHHEEQDELGNHVVDKHPELDGIIDQINPDPASSEGKKLAAELDREAAQSELPFN